MHSIIKNKSFILFCDYYLKSSPQIINLKSSAVHHYKRLMNIHYSSILYSVNSSLDLDEKTYEKLAGKTLDDLNEKFEQFLDELDDRNCDLSFNNGVLTLSLGPKGVYVINRQTPNRQIWLSSPISGPKRYDYIDGRWIYKHDGKSIQDLLQNELSKLFENVKMTIS